MAGYYQDKDWGADSGSDEQCNRVGVTTRSRKISAKLQASKKLPPKASSPKPIKEKNSKQKKNGLSDYELMIQKNIEERMKIFEMLQLGDAKKEFSEMFVMPSATMKRKADEKENPSDEEIDVQPQAKKGRPKNGEVRPKKYGPYKQAKQPGVPLQMALRDRTTKTINYAEDYKNLYKAAKEYKVDKTSRKAMLNKIIDINRKPSTLSMTLRTTRSRRQLEEAMETEEDDVPPPDPVTLSSTYAYQEALEESTSFIEDIGRRLQTEEKVGKEKESSVQDLQEFIQFMKTFETDKQDWARLSHRKISSIAWHPSSDGLLLGAGTAEGSISFWDVDYQGEGQMIRPYDVFSSPVTGLNFDAFNPCRLFSTCKDGEIRELDLPSGVINEVYSAPVANKGSPLTQHIQRDSSSLLVSQANGRVLLMDLRAPFRRRVQQKMNCFGSGILSLSLNPVDANLFMAGSAKREVAIFDLRKTGTSLTEELAEPVSVLPSRPVNVNGSLFSPLTGKYALTMGQNLFQIFDLLGLQAGAVEPLSARLSLNLSEHQGNSTSSLKHAMWHPDREDVFFVGGMNHPKRIDMFSIEDGQVLHSLDGSWLTQESGLSCFHPTVPILAAVSDRSGRVHLCRPPV